MAHGREDWAGTAQISGLWGVSDLGELAARLGSFSTFDRRGNVVWANRFEDGYSGWSQAHVGTGSAFYLYADGAFRAPLSAQIVAGAGATGLAQLQVNLPIPPVSRLGAEWWWANVTADDGYYTMGLKISEGGRQYYAIARIDPATKELLIYDDTLGWTVLTTLSEALFQSDVWHLTKIVCDIESLAYVRVLFDDLVFDASAYAMKDYAATTERLIMPYIRCAVKTTASPTMNVGGAIVTYNEP